MSEGGMHTGGRALGRAAALAGTAGLLWAAGALFWTAPLRGGPRVGAAAFARVPNVIYEPEPTSGPYVVVAVDNHFHDIHPEDDPQIAADRPFVVKNEGGNLHNFTVVGTGISIDILPGHGFTWDPIGAHLPRGVYQVICKYHYYLGMRGEFTVTAP
jgi:hypothetical protein